MSTEDYKNAAGKWAKYKVIEGKHLQTYSYQRWTCMRKRCKEGSTYQEKRPTYVGCRMSALFTDFQSFTDWHTSQVGYGLQGYHMDKDILSEGNKLYSESNCVLVPQQLNLFLTACDAARGAYPQGVHWNKKKKKFSANLNISGKRKHIGHYTTPEAASFAYKAAKEAEAYRWYERLKVGEFVVDERVIERMRTWELENV